MNTPTVDTNATTSNANAHGSRTRPRQHGGVRPGVRRRQVEQRLGKRDAHSEARSARRGW